MEQITKIISWYESTTIKSVESLMKARRKLVAAHAQLALEVGEASKEYRKLYVDRKIYFSKQIAAAPKMSNAAAENMVIASEGYAEIRRKEATANGEKEAGRLLFQAVDNVLKAMSQEIAEEREINRKIQISNKEQK